MSRKSCTESQCKKCQKPRFFDFCLRLVQWQAEVLSPIFCYFSNDMSAVTRNYRNIDSIGSPSSWKFGVSVGVYFKRWFSSACSAWFHCASRTFNDINESYENLLLSSIPKIRVHRVENPWKNHKNRVLCLFLRLHSCWQTHETTLLYLVLATSMLCVYGQSHRIWVRARWVYDMGTTRAPILNWNLKFQVFLSGFPNRKFNVS